MPEIYRFNGIKIHLYYKDHAPPHLHANYGDEWASFVIEDASIMAGSMNRLAASLVRKWIKKHRPAIMRAWDLALREKSPGKIHDASPRKKHNKRKRNYKRKP